MYGIFTYIYHKNQPNVGKYTSPMDGMGELNQFVTPHRKKIQTSVADGHSASERDLFLGWWVSENVILFNGWLSDLQSSGVKVGHGGEKSPGGWLLLLLFFILLKIGGETFFLQNLKFVGDSVNDFFWFP